MRLQFSAGAITCRKIRVTKKAGRWPTFVFASRDIPRRTIYWLSLYSQGWGPFKGNSGARTPLKCKIYGVPTGFNRFVLIPGRYPVRRGLAPVLGPLGKPSEIRMEPAFFQGPSDIAHIVGSDPQFRTVGHHPGQRIQIGPPGKAPLLVAALGPGIGEEQIDPLHAGIGQARQ